MKLDKESEFRKKWRKWRPRILAVLVILGVLVALGFIFDVDEQIRDAAKGEGKYSSFAEMVQQVGWLRSLLVGAFVVVVLWAIGEEKKQQRAIGEEKRQQK